MTIEGGQFNENQQEAVPRVEVKLDTSDRSQAADEMAEDLLTPENPTDQILVDIFEARFDDAKIALGPSYNQISEEFARMIDQGFAYQGISKNTDTPGILWSKEGQTSEKSFQDYFAKKEDYEKFIAIFEGQKLTSSRELSKDPEKQAREFCARVIGKFLTGKGFNLTYDEYMSSDMVVKELLPVLKAGYEGKSPYDFSEGEKGFYLENKSAQFPNHEYLLADYDERLNLKAPAQKVAESGVETEKDYEPDAAMLVPVSSTKVNMAGENGEMQTGYKIVFPSGRTVSVSGEDEAHAKEVAERVETERLMIEEIQNSEFPEETQLVQELKSLKNGDDPNNPFTPEKFRTVENQLWQKLSEKSPEVNELFEQKKAAQEAQKNLRDAIEQNRPGDLWKAGAASRDSLKNFDAQFNTLKGLAAERKDNKLLAALDMLER